jgi:PadR family transcriptional regulator, regulatory protein PadR
MDTQENPPGQALESAPHTSTLTPLLETKASNSKSTKSETMNIENTQSQMRKGVLEFCILSIIKRGEAYPSDIIEEMKKAGLQILEGTLYPLLTRLKNAELLNYRWVESISGPPRKYFTLTEKGSAMYGDLEKTWREMNDSVNAIIHPSVSGNGFMQDTEPTPSTSTPQL